jgi:hypothetical protein
MWRTQATAAALRALGQLLCTLGAAGAVLLTVRLAEERQATIAGLLLVIMILERGQIREYGSHRGARNAGAQAPRLVRMKRSFFSRTDGGAPQPEAQPVSG